MSLEPLLLSSKSWPNGNTRILLAIYLKVNSTKSLLESYLQKGLRVFPFQWFTDSCIGAWKSRSKIFQEWSMSRGHSKQFAMNRFKDLLLQTFSIGKITVCFDQKLSQLPDVMKWSYIILPRRFVREHSNILAIIKFDSASTTSFLKSNESDVSRVPLMSNFVLRSLWALSKQQFRMRTHINVILEKSQSKHNGRLAYEEDISPAKYHEQLPHLGKTSWT